MFLPSLYNSESVPFLIRYINVVFVMNYSVNMILFYRYNPKYECFRVFILGIFPSLSVDISVPRIKQHRGSVLSSY